MFQFGMVKEKKNSITIWDEVQTWSDPQLYSDSQTKVSNVTYFVNSCWEQDIQYPFTANVGGKEEERKWGREEEMHKRSMSHSYLGRKAWRWSCGPRGRRWGWSRAAAAAAAAGVWCGGGGTRSSRSGWWWWSRPTRTLRWNTNSTTTRSWPKPSPNRLPLPADMPTLQSWQGVWWWVLHSQSWRGIILAQWMTMTAPYAELKSFQASIILWPELRHRDSSLLLE